MKNKLVKRVLWTIAVCILWLPIARFFYDICYEHAGVLEKNIWNTLTMFFYYSVVAAIYIALLALLVLLYAFIKHVRVSRLSE